MTTVDMAKQVKADLEKAEQEAAVLSGRCSEAKHALAELQRALNAKREEVKTLRAVQARYAPDPDAPAPEANQPGPPKRD